jgi:fructose-1,6-bisphosphatase II
MPSVTKVNEMLEHPPPQNLGLNLVRATEVAALSAGRWMGLGKQAEANHDAMEAMCSVLNSLHIDGRIAIGEEGKLGVHSPLDSGHSVGTGDGPTMDLVADPIDGVRLLAQGHPGAIAVAAAAPSGSMWTPSPAIYMEKIVVDREAADALVPECLDAPAAWTLALVARVKKKAVRDLVVFVLDRPRHYDLIEEIRVAGARAMLRTDGDIAGALLAASRHSGVDILMGIGGVPEGVIAACAVRAKAGAMLGRLAAQGDEERAAIRAAGLDTERILTCRDLVCGDEIFFAATGITDGPVLRGVRYHGSTAETESLVLRCETGSRRLVHIEHFVD